VIRLNRCSITSPPGIIVVSLDKLGEYISPPISNRVEVQAVDTVRFGSESDIARSVSKRGPWAKR
jgi:hypothetical protein